MSTSIPSGTLEKFTTFGDLLRFLRRRTGLTQLELSIEVGYSDAQISRLEQNLRLPDLTTIEARFVSALKLEDEPKAVARLLELAANVRREDAPALGLCPYKGLNYFDEADADLFVGREALSAKLVERVLALTLRPGSGQALRGSRHQRRFLTVVGASGSGKSSLVRAGLVSALRWNKSSADWQIQVLIPTAHPLESLAANLTHESVSVSATATLMDDLAREPRSLHLFAKRKLQSENGSRLLLVIDQFEELFALCRSDEERTSFIRNLLGAASEADGPAVIVITLRADFYAHCASYPELREALAREQEYIGAMSDEELRQAIEEPARRERWEFEPGLVDLLLHDVGHEPGALPLLSHALLETWQRRRGRLMTFSGYASSGGVRGAIAETAETVFTDQFTHEQQAIARHVFLRLTELGDETATGDTRRRATFNELILKPEEADTTRAVLKALADARLITIGEEAAEVAHEALIREWPTLRGWLEDNREGLRLHRHLTEAAQEWAEMNREPDMLYRGARLTQVREWVKEHAEEMNSLEHEFLNASMEQGEREAREREAQRQRELEAAQKLAEAQRQRAEEQARAAAQLRKRALYLTGAFIVALILAFVALFLGEQSNQNAVKAKRNAAESQNVALIAGSQAALANGNTDQAIALALQAVTLDPLSNRAQVALDEAAYAPGTIRRFVGPGGSIDSVELSPDGRTALTATSGWQGPASVLLWDLQTGKMIRQFEGYDSGTSVAEYSPDGHMVLSEDDRTLILWNIETGAIIRRFEGSTGKIYALAFSPDGHTAISGGTDKTLLLWDIQTGQIIRRFGADGQGHTDDINCVAFSPDGRTALSGSTDKTLILWDVSTGQAIRRFGGNGGGHANPVLSVAFSPDGNQVLSGAEESVMILWDVATGNVIRRFYGHRGWVQDVAFSPDGRWALSGGGDATMILWDIATGQPISHFQGHEKFVQSVAFSRDGHTALSGSADGTLRLWDLEGGQVIRRFTGHTSWAFGVARSPDGQTALTSSTDGTAILWDLQTGKEIPRFTSPRPVVDVAYSPDGQTALIATGMFMNEPSDVVLWDIKTGQVIRRFVGHPAGALFVAFSPDGRMAVSSGARGVILLWDVATGKEIRRFQGYESDSPGPPAAAHGLAFSPDGRTLLVGFGDGKLILWDVATGKEIRHFVGHTNIVGQVVFSPDGQQAFSGAWDNTAIYWDVATGSIIHRFTDHSAAVFRVQLTPDGHFGLGGSADNTTILWDLKTGDVIRRYTGSNAGVFNAAFSPDGHNALVSFFDGSVALWRNDATLDELLTWTKANRYIPELTCEQKALYQLEPLCPETTATPTSK